MRTFFGAAVVSVALISITTTQIGCSDFNSYIPKNPGALWTSLNLESKACLQICGNSSSIAIAAGMKGVLQQSPAFSGEWRPIGLSFPNHGEDTLSAGVFALTSHNGTLVAMVGLRADSARGMYRRPRGSSSWIKVPNVSAYSLTSTSSRIVGLSQTGIIYSEDDGATWTILAMPQYFFGGARIESTTAGLFASTNLIDLSLHIIRSKDEGTSWLPVSTEGLPPEEAVISLDARLNPGQIVANVGGKIYLSNSLDGGNFHRILTLNLVEGEVLLDPEASQEILVASDSLYWSGDSGASWHLEALPKEGFIARSHLALWRDSLAVLPVWTSQAQFGLYCLNIGLLR